MDEIIIYKDANFYSHNPSVIKARNGELLLVFRRAPQRKPYSDHIDSESTATMVRSKDDGNTWTPPELVYKKEYGVQDPSIAQLKDGTLVCNYFQWQVVFKEPFNHSVVGTFLNRSFDDGKNWEKDAIQVPIGGYLNGGPTEPVLELPDGEIIMPLYGTKGKNVYDSFIVRSKDRGQTWSGLTVIAGDPLGKTYFYEPTLCLTKSGKILCLIRNDYDGYLIQSYSSDGGKTWAKPERLDLWGFPANLINLSDGRILASYGYRRQPFGVRICVSEDEGRTWDPKREIVIRNDGLHGDIGYPSAVELSPGKVLVTYYHHISRIAPKDNIDFFTAVEGTRYIAGTVVVI